MMSSTMIAPALAVIAHDLHIQSQSVVQLALSSFVLSYAFAPIFIAPLSEIFGRMQVLQIANFWFLIWTVVSGFANN